MDALGPFLLPSPHIPAVHALVFPSVCGGLLKESRIAKQIISEGEGNKMVVGFYIGGWF